MLQHSPFDVLAALSPVRRRLGLRRMGTWAMHGGIGGCLTGAMLLTAGRVFSAEWSIPVSFMCLLVGPALAAVMASLRWPTTLDAARAADGHFSLHDRLTTALEFRYSEEPIAIAQRQQAGAWAHDLPLIQSAEFSVRRRTVGAVAVTLALFAAALLTPTTSHATPRSSGVRSLHVNMDAVRRVALAHVGVISRQFTAGLTPAQRRSPQAKKAASVISELRAALNRAHGREEALRQISAAQARLHRIVSSLETVRPEAASKIAKSLSGAMTRSQRDEASKGGNHVNRAAADTLNQLAASASREGPKQRLRDASLLQRAAPNSPDNKMQNYLQQAASALGHNDAKTARDALRRAATRLASSVDNRATRAQLSNTRHSLDSVKNDVNGIGRKQNSASASAAKSSAGRSPSAGGRESKNQGRTVPSAGHGVDKQAHGKGSGRRGNQGLDEFAQGGGQQRAGNARGNGYAVVFVPGLIAKGQHLLPVELRGAPRSIPVVPYRRVIAHYNQTVRITLQRSSLPPALQQYVRRYFTKLAH